MSCRTGPGYVSEDAPSSLKKGAVCAIMLSSRKGNPDLTGQICRKEGFFMDIGREVYPAVAALTEEKRQEGKSLARHLGVPLFTSAEETVGLSMVLRLDDSGLTLVSGNLSLQGDFRRMLRRITGGRLDHELLVKAAR